MVDKLSHLCKVQKLPALITINAATSLLGPAIFLLLSWSLLLVGWFSSKHAG